MPNRSFNVLVTLDENYIPYLNVMLTSLLHSNPSCFFDVWLLHTAIPQGKTENTERILGKNGDLHLVEAKDIGLDSAPTTSRYPKEIYYRIFAAKYLPESIDRILYLDPDIIVNGSIKELYDLPMEDYYFAAASHTGPVLTGFNSVRLGMAFDSVYINSGVMLMNLEILRREQDLGEVFEFIEKNKNILMLPDQDIISSLYGSKIYALDTFRYNMTEKLYTRHAVFEKTLDLDWVRDHSVIIHYIGKNKPWRDDYRGKLNIFYNETVEMMEVK